MQRNFLKRRNEILSAYAVVSVSLLFTILIGLRFAVVGLIPLLFGLIFLHIPVRQWNTTQNKKQRSLHKLISVQLALNILIGGTLTVVVLVSTWKARFCPKIRDFGDVGLRCMDNIHDLFTLELGNIQSKVFDDTLHIGSIWYYIPASIVLTIMIAAYLLTRKRAVS